MAAFAEVDAQVQTVEEHIDAHTAYHQPCLHRCAIRIRDEGLLMRAEG
jgi:hypothetical protein